MPQNSTDLGGSLGGSSGNGGNGGFGLFNIVGNSPEAVIKNISGMISNLVAFITILAGLWFGFQLILGAIQWITSGGDKHGLESARNRMLHALVGLIIVVMALSIVGFIGKIFGLDILLTNPSCTANQLMGRPCQ